MSGDWRRRVEEAFRRVASEVGGTYDDTSHWSRPVVQKRTGDWIVTLAWEALPQGAHTVVRAPFHNPRRFRFVVRDERLMDDFLKTFGFLQDVKVGDESFDRRFVVKGFPTGRVRALLDGRVRELLEAQESVDLRVAPTTVHPPTLVPTTTSPTAFPRGVEELHFRESWAVTDERRLVGLFELFGELLPRLALPDGGGGDEVERLVRRLEAPGGTTRSPPGGPLVLWDGDTPRRDAAARLGRLGDPRAVEPLVSVLQDPDDALVAVALRALAELGDPRAVPSLVPLLGEREREVGTAPVGAVAGEALEALGRGDLARAFDRALEGEADPLRSVAGDLRGEVVQALMVVVDSVDFASRVEAARALGELGAAEALPLLRSKSRAWGMRTRLTEAAEEAVRAIEARASLPRPASPEPEAAEEADTLPRPADGAAGDGSTLPRPAEGEGPG